MKNLDGFNVELNGIEGVAKKQTVRCAVRAVLEGSAYAEIEPPILGYYSDMTSRWSLDEARVFKFTDFDGQLLALAPDLTLAAGNIALNEYLKNTEKPLRIYYVGKAYTFKKEHMRDRVYDQVGAELVGIGGIEADAEIISLAARAVEACGCDMTTVFVELSELRYMKSLLAGYGLTEDEKKVLTAHIARKNTFSMRKDKGNESLCAKVGELLDAVPSLYGEASDVLPKAVALAKSLGNEAAAEAAERTAKLCTLLKEKVCGANICLDFATFADDSYSGVVFQGMSQKLGAPLFSGGRYDGVLGREQGLMVPATGFSISVDALVKLAEAAE